jgi:hypothetical protein
MPNQLGERAAGSLRAQDVAQLHGHSPLHDAVIYEVKSQRIRIGDRWPRTSPLVRPPRP